MTLTLENACAQYLFHHSDAGRIVLGTSLGKLLLLSLVADSSNTVKSLTLKELTGKFINDLHLVYSEVSTPYCLSQCAPGHLFIGSRLGDSQLLQYTISNTGILLECYFHNKILDTNGQLAEKRKKLDENRLDEEDLELYGDAEEAEIDQTVEEGSEEVWIFNELDRLLNIAPVKSLTAGTVSDLSFHLQDKYRVDPVFQFVLVFFTKKNVFESRLAPVDMEKTDHWLYWREQFAPISSPVPV